MLAAIPGASSSKAGALLDLLLPRSLRVSSFKRTARVDIVCSRLPTLTRCPTFSKGANVDFSLPISKEESKAFSGNLSSRGT